MYHQIVAANHAPPGTPPILGVINGTAEWIFSFEDRISVTVSGADAIVDRDREELARFLSSRTEGAAQFDAVGFSQGFHLRAEVGVRVNDALGDAGAAAGEEDGGRFVRLRASGWSPEGRIAGCATPTMQSLPVRLRSCRSHWGFQSTRWYSQS